MNKIIFSTVIGVIYGAGSYIIFINSVKFLNRKLVSKANPNINLIKFQTTVIIVVSGLLLPALFLTSLFLKPFFSDWHLFKKIFGIGYMMGMLIISLIWRNRQ